MPNAIGGSGLLASAGLDAEIQRYKRQLADCVNCPATSKSPEGKALIQELSGKISADQDAIRTIESSRRAGGRAAATSPVGQPAVYTATGAAAGISGASPGSRLNLYA